VSLFTVFVALGTALFLLSTFSPGETEPTPINGSLVEFYGRECPHCTRMAPIVSQVEAELNITFSKLEVWHNSGNYKIFESYAKSINPACEGSLAVPAFYNIASGKALCGEVSKQELISFALAR
ncbi:MAG: thioredoxin family protein, partial [Candidatus Micrarchaeota archaeon]